MASRKSTKTAILEVPTLDEAVVLELEAASIEVNKVPTVEVEFDMGEFKVFPHAERQYASLYFGLRSLYGQAVRLRDKEIDWSKFTPVFEQCFGSIEERRFSMEELSEFAWSYFHKTVEEVVEHNKKSLARRNEQIDGEVKAEVEMPKPKPVINMDDIPY